jgi:DNA-binding GntR family transcriptional regulator
MAISRKPLRNDVHRELQDLILQGALSPGQRISDTDLAARIGVSRTPVREALLRLEREGFILSSQHQGFAVKPLSTKEIRDIYPMVGLLECYGLQSIPPLSAKKVEQLNRISTAMEKEVAKPLRRIQLDDEWHRALLSDNGNNYLTQILGDLKHLILRYEYTFMQVSEWVTVSLGEHAQMIEDLRQDRRQEAIRILGNHWDRSMEAVLSNFFVPAPPA